LAGIAGTRVPWRRVPPAVRASIEDRLESTVVSAHSQEAGFSPALAARLLLADERRVFVKAIGPDALSGAPGGQGSYRREARIAAALPTSLAAPALIETWEAEGWVILCFEDIEGTNPALPWEDDELLRVLEALTLASAALTPSPVDAPAAATPGGSDHWRQLASQPQSIALLQGLGHWVRENLDLLVELEASSEAAAAGDTLAHFDLRADNIVLARRDVFFVDWPNARVGAPWLDLAYFLPSVAMQGGPLPDKMFWGHPLARFAQRRDVSSVLAGLAGFMVHGATLPPPPGIPTLRRFQLAQGQQAVRWVREMSGAGGSS
jgi:Phosphotransferase enzyme family